jgi:5-methylcytosine-specific restriction endonuclease McrA
MRKHTKIYFDYFGYTGQEFIACEVCGRKAVDIHHIDCKGMGGATSKDKIENLMAVCRECHIKYGDKKDLIDFLIQIHKDFIENYGKFY